MRRARFTPIAANNFHSHVNLFLASFERLLPSQRQHIDKMIKLFPRNGKGLEKAQYWPTYEKDDETPRETRLSMKYANAHAVIVICIKVWNLVTNTTLQFTQDEPKRNNISFTKFSNVRLTDEL